jgi:hypothetical protein
MASAIMRPNGSMSMEEPPTTTAQERLSFHRV